MTGTAPYPTPDPDTEPYWQGLREHRLRVQRCAGCGKLRHYPRPVCDACFSMAVEWADLTGRGTIHSWTETHHAFLPAFREDVPYVLVTVDLEEGVRMNARLDPRDGLPACGMAVTCGFEPAGEGWVFPVFRLS